ncbi:hypothetical protein Godav_028230 [Gossypium davidsonii]|uniref:Uncharacterized protein n=2 Tax=Gossypium TaxID=3633 RepID=A0A7J8RYQ3_GOSDV|nr:hypothetical protein [Gossypium davidsonii]MBA0670971.1 hypothetical protein [Gossypium klotzschianum]
MALPKPSLASLLLTFKHHNHLISIIQSSIQ